MPEPNLAVATIRFGKFEVNLRTGELRKSGVRIRLQDQPFKVLASLLEQPGEMVTREELRRRIWPDEEFGDFDHAVNLAVAKVRTALGDSADLPKFVETLPRRGYRFIGTITPPPQISVPAEAVRPARGFSTKLAIAAGLLVLLVVALSVLISYRWFRARPGPPTFTPVPFTALTGDEDAPAFSPDGSRIAFIWNGDPASGAGGFDLYVKAIGSETLLRLTTRPSGWLSPAWSPDGTQIAFHRLAGPDTGIYIVPALGGPERKLRSTRVPYPVAAPISWSPDGKWIGFGEPLPDKAEDRMFLLSVETLEVRPLPHNPNCLHEATPTFSHAGDRLAFLCVRNTNEFELYTSTADGQAPKRVAAFSDFPIGFAWSADDRKLLVSLKPDNGPFLWEVLLADGSLRRLDFATFPAWPAVSPKGDKLAYSVSYDTINLSRRDLLHPDTPAIKLIPTTQEQDDPQLSPDGRSIAFRSSRGGSEAIWLSDAGGNNLVQLSKSNRDSSWPRWSPDGKNIAFQSHASGRFEIYIADISERTPHKFIPNLLEDVATPSWSHDGKWLYFRSYEPTGHKIYRAPAAGGDAAELSALPDATAPQESFDGSTLYFAERPAHTAIRKISLKDNFTESPLDGMPTVASYTLWTVAANGIYFVPDNSPGSLCYFDFASKKVRTLFHPEKGFSNGLSVSSDGRWLLYSQYDDENTDLVLVDHFK